MRQLERLGLEQATGAFLESAHGELESQLQALAPRLAEQGELERSDALYEKAKEMVDGLWKLARQRRGMDGVEAALRRMTGPRERCMFCCDSKASDVDHFRPRRHWRLVFAWKNLLWICTPCNRQKSEKFPLDVKGRPLLIDPTAEDPWQRIFYDSKTHNLVPRWLDAEREDPKAKATLEEVLPRLNHEHLTEGRRLDWGALTRAARRALGGPRPTTDEATAGLLRELDEHDGFGLDRWCVLLEGRDEEPFRSLRRERPGLWQRAVLHCEGKVT